MNLFEKNSDASELENTEILDSAVKNAARRRGLASERYNDISELHPKESSLVGGGFCNHEIIITCGMFCDTP